MDFLFKLGLVAAKQLLKNPDKVASAVSAIKENRENSKKIKEQELEAKEESVFLENMLKETISKFDLSNSAELDKAIMELQLNKNRQISSISSKFEIKISRKSGQPTIEAGLTKIKYEISVISDPTGIKEVDCEKFIAQIISDNFTNTDVLKFVGQQIEFHFPISKPDIYPIKSELNSILEKINQVGLGRVKDLEQLTVEKLERRYKNAATAISQLHHSLAG